MQLMVTSLMVALLAAAPAPLSVVEMARITLPAEDSDGKALDEISGLAWDADDRLLYAVSDEGKLFHISFEGGIGPGMKAAVIRTVKLRGGGGFRNAEGIETINGANGIKGDGRLLVAFEDGPALQVHAPDGSLLEVLAVPEPLRDASQYQTQNDGIEALAIDPVHGVLVAPELPLQGHSPDDHTIYGLRGKNFHYLRMRGAQAPTGRIKAIAATPGGRLYVLERHRDDTSLEYVSVIRRIGNCGEAATSHCEALTLADPARVLHGLPYEGMSFLDESTAVIAADIKKSEGQTILVVVRLETRLNQVPGRSEGSRK
jgi:Esterase-like activity of phytase